ncbi:MAG: class I SAM-dependent methyltransferase [Candidatus Methanomethylophilaceae archaeon]|nr:class I SAM-dependent methyltransferase [Candidatus Methanomethylophilaceae archaeon]
MAEEILRSGAGPKTCDGDIRSNLIPAFYYYIGTMLAAHGQGGRAIEWLREATLCEESGLLSACYLYGFLERHNRRLVMPATAFSDPRPFQHLITVPLMYDARKRFVAECCSTLPHVDGPFSLMDIGWGGGDLTVSLLQRLLDTGRVTEVGEVLLIDPSIAMVSLAEKTVRAAFPDLRIETANSRIQDVSGGIDHHFDLAISSLAFHHMPLEQKRIQLSNLKHRIDHFALFEPDANSDTPERYSPDLALSVYQSFGCIIDRIFLHDARWRWPLPTWTGS